MCTAISDCKKYHLFGRTFDFEKTYGEKLVITPRNFCFDFEKSKGEKEKSLALMGIACVKNGVPLYFDAINEASLAAAALSFPVSCVYKAPMNDKINIPSFELISRVLRCCDSLDEARAMLETVNVTDESFSKDVKASPLHWIFADRSACICVESVEDGLKIYDNPFRVLTNEPPFWYHTTRVRDFLNLSPTPIENALCPDFKLEEYTRGSGAYGLPGDFSSPSRFVRALFMKSHTEIYPTDDAEESELQRFFHITDSLCVPYGTVVTKENERVRTLYRSCANTDTLTYYYTTYLCRSIRYARMKDAELDAKDLTVTSIYG